MKSKQLVNTPRPGVLLPELGFLGPDGAASEGGAEGRELCASQEEARVEGRSSRASSKAEGRGLLSPGVPY